jgi:hypothetical protein
MQISAGTGSERSWAIQASPEKLAHSKDRVLMLCFFQRTRGSELLVESDVAVECFLGGDEVTSLEALGESETQRNGEWDLRPGRRRATVRRVQLCGILNFGNLGEIEKEGII